MTAKKMFTKLGFKLTTNNNRFITYTYLRNGFDYNITFRLWNKDIDIVDNASIEFLKLDVLQAINKQVEEMGWNK